jgi:hypothetical protein
MLTDSQLPPYIDEQHWRAAARAVQSAPVTAVMVSPQDGRKIDRTALSEQPKLPKRANTKRWWLLLLVCVIIGGIAAIALVPDAIVDAGRHI